MNASDAAVLTLAEGDALVVPVVRKSDRLDILIQRDGETPVYRADDAESGEFRPEIDSDGITRSPSPEKNGGSGSLIREAGNERFPVDDKE